MPLCEPERKGAMIGLRQRISLGFGGVLLILLVVGYQSLMNLTHLGQSVDVILRENYRSVIACQEMKESLERIDSGILFVLLGDTEEGYGLIQEHEAAFEKALAAELGNITLPGEGQKAERLRELYTEYKDTLNSERGRKALNGGRRAFYFEELLPLFDGIKASADGILQMNQRNMSEANDRARSRAAYARRQMSILVSVGLAVGLGFVLLTGRWILRPIGRLTRSAEEIKRGNLDLVVQSDSRDEIGRLSEAFNEMASALRESRRKDYSRMSRIQRATEQTFNSLPDAVAIVDTRGRVEVATETARNTFGLKPETQLSSLPLPWAGEVFSGALERGRPAGGKGTRRVVQHFVGGEEHYFRPQAIPILDSDRQPTGVVLMLQDVTQEREQEEMKGGIIATVSHQLKTPLTSIRMAIHLLLEEKVGALTPKQTELLVAAREESDRLYGILTGLLDINRMESGRAGLELRRAPSQSVVVEALEPLEADFKDKGVSLVSLVQYDLPDVWADVARVKHVFANLLSNALRYTPAGGKVTVGARADEKWVHFSVSDTGAGIPGEYLGHVFEPFFRVPDQETVTGVGLGLSIAREIVEAHGGTITAESRPGEGSTFAFTLKRADRAGEGDGKA